MLELPYVAGLIDGEGSIQLRHGASWSFALTLRVSVSMTHQDVIRLLHEQFGGSFRSTAQRKANHKSMHTFAVGQGEAFALVSSIQPWLVVKRRQADLAIMWWNNRKFVDRDPSNQAVFFEVMRRLNKRGV